MPRLIEFLLFVFIVYLAYRRISGPFRRGYDARDRERAEHERLRRQQMNSRMQEQQPYHREPNAVVNPKIDRTQVEDAEFEDLDDRK